MDTLRHRDLHGIAAYHRQVRPAWGRQAACTPATGGRWRGESGTRTRTRRWRARSCD